MALAGEIANLIVALKLDDSGFSGKLRGVQGQLSGMQRGFSQIGRGTGQLATGIDRLATRAALAAAGGLTAVITTAASFEQAFTGVEKTVEGTEAQLSELERTLRQMARTIPVSFEELSAIGEAGGALGIAREDLDEFIDVVARLGVSTNLSSDQAATALGQLGNVLHLTGGEFEDFADSLVALGNAGASTESQIVEIAARFGAAANSAGLTKEEILALSSAVASMGIEVESAGTSLSRIFSNVATNIGTSSQKAAAFADTLGLSAREFRTAWERDALGTFQDFLAELSKLDQFAQAKVLQDIGITGVRDINAVRLMTQNLGFFNDQLEISRTATGALDTESQKFFDTTQGQWKILVNNVRDAAATIGAELLPVVNELIKDFVGFLGQPGTQRGLADFAKNLATGVRGLANELRGTDFSGIISGMQTAAGVAKGAFDLFRSLPQPIQQLAVAALVANKVTGGAVGQIAGGLANIIGGSIKILFPKLDIFSRGSPANPMFVSVLGGGLGGGVPAAGGLGKVGGFLGTVGILAADAFLIGEAVAQFQQQSQNVGVARDFVQKVVDDRARNATVDELQKLSSDLQREIDREMGDPLSGILKWALVNGELEQQQREVQARIDAQTKQQTYNAQLSRQAIRTGLFETRNEFRIGRMQLADRMDRVSQRVAEARDRIGTGFNRSNEQLGVIARKKTSFSANVTNNITAYLSSYQAIQTMTRINRIRTDFEPGDSTGGSL